MIKIMKRCLMPALALVFMFFVVNAGGFASAASLNNEADEKLKLTNPLLQVQVNGSIVNAPPYMSLIEGQVMVPLRWSAELLGATSVDWNAASQTVTITTPQDFYSMEKFSAYARALKLPIDELNNQICPLPNKVKDMGIPELLPDRYFVLELEQFEPKSEGLILPAPRPYITIIITSPDGAYEHIRVAHSIENHQGHYYLPMDWLEILFNVQVSYNEAVNILSIQTPNLEQIKSEIERIESSLISDSADEAIKLWCRGMQTRNGALQYVALSPQLRQEAEKSAYVRQSYWVTGGSSPQVGPITIASRNKLSETEIEYTISFPEMASGQTYATATEKMVVEKLSDDGSLGWFITRILESSGYGIIDGDTLLMDSKYDIDLDGDGQNETVKIMANIDNSKWEIIVLKDGSETAAEIFPGDSKGFSASILALGHIMDFDSLDFLLVTDYRSMPFGGCGYELYSLKDEALTQIDIANITEGTPYTINVDEDKQTAQIEANQAVTVVPLSDWDLQGYKLYGDEFCQNFFIEMNLQNVPGQQLPDLITTEVIAATLPQHLAYLHSSYKYVDGAWEIYNTDIVTVPIS